MALVPAADLTRVRESARRFASGFTRGQKAVTISAVLGIALAAMAFMSFAGKPTYSILFTNLQPSDAASITQKLATDHVPYQLQDGGATILVPQNEVDQERLAVAQLGLPTQSTSGLSILDKEGMTTSQLTQQADYLRAIQGELEQTIDSINGVTSSVVNVAMPANQTFVLGNTNPTGASVLVTLTPGTTLSYNEVQAITSLVASSVPGLAEADVTLADSSGTLLAGPGVSASGQQTSAASAYDAQAQARIAAYLATVLGAGNADVQVNAQLNFDQVKTSTQTLLTGTNGKPQTACTSTQQSSTKYTGSGSPPGSTLATSTSGSNGSYTQSSTQNTCEAATKTQTVLQAPGVVQTQSVAVLVNKKALPKGISLANLQAGVAAAAGINKARGDVLSFSAAPFAPAATGAVAAAAKASMLALYLKPGLAALLVLLLLFLMWRASRKAKKAALRGEGSFEGPGFDPFAMLGGADPITAELPVVSAARPSQLSTIQEMVDAQPEEVATVLRSWLQHST